MRQSDLFSYLNNEISIKELKEKISHELHQYEKQTKITGSSVPIYLEAENNKNQLSLSQFNKLLRDYINNEIEVLELQYISDVIQLGESISVENPLINNWIFEMSDPEINGLFTKERAKEIIQTLTNV